MSERPTSDDVEWLEYLEETAEGINAEYDELGKRIYRDAFGNRRERDWTDDPQ